MIKLLSTNFGLRTICGPQSQEISSWGSSNQSKMVLIHYQWDATSFSGSDEGLGTETGMKVEKRSHKIQTWRATEPREALEVVPFPHPAANSPGWNWDHQRGGWGLWEVGPFLYEGLAPTRLEVSHRIATLMGGEKDWLIHWAACSRLFYVVMSNQILQIPSDGKNRPPPCHPTLVPD